MFCMPDLLQHGIGDRDGWIKITAAAYSIMILGLRLQPGKIVGFVFLNIFLGIFKTSVGSRTECKVPVLSNNSTEKFTDQITVY